VKPSGKRREEAGELGVRWRAAVWRLCAGVRSARVRTPETQVQTAPGVGLRGWRGRSNCQLTSPPSGQSQLKAVTHGGKVNSKAVTPGPKSTGVRFRRRLTNRTNESNPQLSKACQPCTSAAHNRAPPPRTAVLPPLCRRAPSRTHAPSHAAPAVSQASRLSYWRRLTPLARRLLHIMYCLGAQYCITLWQIFSAHNRSDAAACSCSFSSAAFRARTSLVDARPSATASPCPITIP